MDRIAGTNVTDLGGGRRGFRDRNLSLGLRGTNHNAVYHNDLQEEIVGGIIEHAGLTPQAGQRTQLRQALTTLFGGGGTLAGSGWQRLPGGLIVQWGYFQPPNNSSQSWGVTFPVAFPTANFVVLATLYNSTAATGAVSIFTPGLSGFVFFQSWTGGQVANYGVAWIAIGR